MAAVIPAEAGLEPPQDALNRLTLLVAADLERVNQTILKRMDSSVELIPTLAGHLIRAGGKRIRPLLTLASARSLGYKGEKHVLLAAAVEFIHTATLLHDDVVDESDLRRGNATANIIWGNQASVLVGDFLFSRAFQLMTESSDMKVLQILANASAVIAEGEVMQLSAANDTKTTEEIYLKVISAKTAALFAAAAQVGASVSQANPTEEKSFRDFGEAIGIAFQLIDDALDYSGAADAMGKSVGDDFREGKITLPIVLAYSRGTEEERKFWRRTLEDRDQREGDLARAIETLRRREALRDTVQRARDYGDAARHALSHLPRNAYTAALDGIIDFCISRAY